MVSIRQWDWKDSVVLTRLINNKKIWDNVRDFLPHPYTLRDADAFLSHHVGVDPCTNFAILFDGEVAGGIGYIPKDDVYKLSAEIGYWVGEPYWGKGVATTAIGMIVDKIREQSTGILRIYAEVFENNKASIGALAKNGFQLEAIRKKSVVKNGIIMNDHVYVMFPGE